MIELVWIESERCFGEVIKRNHAYSLVRFFNDGIDHEEFIENDDLIDLADME